MIKNIHNFYRPNDVLYLVQNRYHWCTCYEFDSDGFWKTVVLSDLGIIQTNNVSHQYKFEMKVFRKLTGKTYDWFL